MMSLLIATLVNTAFAAQPSACPQKKAAKLSGQCLIEVTNAIAADPLGQTMRTTLGRERRLGNCQPDTADKPTWKYEKDDATGPSLKTSLFHSCENAEAISGYRITGKYYLDASLGAYDFTGLELETYE